MGFVRGCFQWRTCKNKAHLAYWWYLYLYIFINKSNKQWSMMDPFASRGQFNLFIWSQDHACMKSSDVSILRVLLSDRNLHADITGPKSGYKRTWNETFFKQPETKWKHLFMRFLLDQRPSAIGLQAQRCKHLDIKARCWVVIQCAFHTQELLSSLPGVGILTSPEKCSFQVAA